MNKSFWALCLTLYPVAVGATNFEACINEATQNSSATIADGYTSYKCEGVTAERLSARPDECPGGTKPALRSLGLARTSRQLEDGLNMSLTWAVGQCTGSCDMQANNSRDTTYHCEVRVYGNSLPPETAGKPPENAGRPSWPPGRPPENASRPPGNPRPPWTPGRPP